MRALIDDGSLIQAADGQWQLTRSIETIRGSGYRLIEDSER